MLGTRSDLAEVNWAKYSLRSRWPSRALSQTLLGTLSDLTEVYWAEDSLWPR